ncbi:uncharacterized protein LOC110707950 [Chenopodium quinoa]|uniref:uncharacterized protein LOC110707950 n=1 Tax=Chenopodium quinoa TaxID=63459 RepID=UPI000B78C70F|nr:uncharacterized protein LOC110707950 [Chenopodium quinoa]
MLERKRRTQTLFTGGEKRLKPNGNYQGNYEDRRDNKRNFGKGNGCQSSNAREIGNQRSEKPQRKYFYKRCEKDHPRKDCEEKLVTCRYYQKLGHRKVKESSVPSKPPQSSGPTPKVGTSSVAGGAPKGRMFVMRSCEAKTANNVVIGVFLISSLPVKVLFDSGASHSFNSKRVVGSLRLESPEPVSLDMSIPSGEVRSCSKLFKSIPISIYVVEFLSDLIEFDLKDLDVILCMDWLGKYDAKIDCAAEKVTLTSLSKARVVYKKEGKSSRLRIIFAIQLQKLVKKGCPLFLCSVQEIDSEEKKGDVSIPVVEEFPDVFLDEIPGMPPVRDVKFTIDLVLGTRPISKAPYRMAPAEMKELKTLDDLLEKGYIRPSSLP